jgi:succinoglycan biosynthesis protein ExoM
MSNDNAMADPLHRGGEPVAAVDLEAAEAPRRRPVLRARAQTHAEMVQVSVIICTHERPALLAEAVGSLLALDGLERAAFDIVIVDNSDSGSAKAVVERLRQGARVAITYIEAHPSNISRARNAGLAATEAQIIAFLDDDQAVDRGWLDAVLDGLARFPHDVFFGPIRPRFEDQSLANRHAQAMFTRSIAAQAGTDLAAFGQSPAPTANSIFRRKRTFRVPAPFDESFGESGGEDFHLFCLLQRQGCRFGWLPDASASDFVPKHRCSYPYLTDRHFAGAQVYASVIIGTSPTPRLTQGVILFKALVQAALLFAQAALLLATRRTRWCDVKIRMAAVFGKIFWRRRHLLYKHERRRYGTVVSDPA